MNTCPFKAGDYVIYKPSRRGYNLEDGVRLEIGRKYRITKIEQDNYVVIDGYQHPGGGLYWTEFEKASDKMTQKGFYLASHDLCSDPRPRRCEVVHEVKGLRANSRYILVKITPQLKTKFCDGPSMDFDQIILSIVGNRTMQDIGTKPVMAEIVVCPTYSGGTLDERMGSKIGIASLHATYAEALENSPVEES